MVRLLKREQLIQITYFWPDASSVVAYNPGYTCKLLPNWNVSKVLRRQKPILQHNLFAVSTVN